MKAFWDQRYSQKGYVYGEDPNEYFKNQLDGVPPGKILLPAEGEGRNAAYAAALGWEVYAFDISQQGKLKAEALSRKKNVKINYIVGECSEISYPANTFDALGIIYAHFPASRKTGYYKQLTSYLKADGLIIFEAFSKTHIRYQEVNPHAGGPKDIDMLFDISEIKSAFPDTTFAELREEEIDLQEGEYHSGKAMVIRFTGRKNQAPIQKKAL